MTKLSIIIPAYNEEKTIVEILNRVKAVDLEKHSVEKEIIVVSDGSKDRTVERARTVSGIRIIANKHNQGKGGAVRDGIKFATGDIIITQDADLEYNPNEYYRVIRPILEKRAKVVYGSRFMSQTQKKKNLVFAKKNENAYSLAYLGGRIITLATNILYLTWISDEPTGYKCFRSDVIKNIKIDNSRFSWEPEITAKILKKGIKIYEVPISYNPRTFKQGKHINWKDGVAALWTLLKYRF